MKVAVISTKSYDEPFVVAANRGQHDFVFLESRIDASTVALADGSDAICAPSVLTQRFGR